MGHPTTPMARDTLGSSTGTTTFGPSYNARVVTGGKVSPTLRFSHNHVPSSWGKICHGPGHAKLLPTGEHNALVAFRCVYVWPIQSQEKDMGPGPARLRAAGPVGNHGFGRPRRLVLVCLLDPVLRLTAQQNQER